MSLPGSLCVLIVAFTGGILPPNQLCPDLSGHLRGSVLRDPPNGMVESPEVSDSGLKNFSFLTQKKSFFDSVCAASQAPTPCALGPCLAVACVVGVSWCTCHCGLQ